MLSLVVYGTMHWYFLWVQARQGPLLLSLVYGVYVLALVSGLLLLRDPIMLLQVSYMLVWGVGVGNVVKGTVSLSLCYLFSYGWAYHVSSTIFFGGFTPSEVGWEPSEVSCLPS